MDTEGLKEYMSKFGPLDDCIVMKVCDNSTSAINLMKHSLSCVVPKFFSADVLNNFILNIHRSLSNVEN